MKIDPLLLAALSAAGADDWAERLPAQNAAALAPANHGSMSRWYTLLDRAPRAAPSVCDLNADAITIGCVDDLSAGDQTELAETIQALIPWRKGPFSLFGLNIDTEWRSNIKWDRLKDHIAPLDQRLVLDVGCGSGYHCWRMLGQKAKAVVGVDPFLLNVVQFQFVKKLYGGAPIGVLPLAMEELPPALGIFDTVFSMGVLYHRRSPLDHLQALRDCLCAGGELVLETLVIDGKQGETLMPETRYANMRNVWFIPSLPTLERWLKRCRFHDIRCIDVTSTTTEEQRKTPWMPFQSLADFLDSSDKSLTIEGLPAPRRAIVIAKSP